MKCFAEVGWHCSVVDVGCLNLMKLVARVVGCHDLVSVVGHCDGCFGDC